MLYRYDAEKIPTAVRKIPALARAAGEKSESVGKDMYFLQWYEEREWEGERKLDSTHLVWNVLKP